MATSTLTRDFLHQLFDRIPFEVLIFDNTGSILLQNEQFRKQRKLTTLEAMLATVHPDDRETNFVRWTTLLATPTSDESVIRRLSHDGTYRWFQQNIIAINDLLIGLYFDIHQYKEIHTGISHSIRNPLTSAKLKAQIAAKIAVDQRQIDVYLQIVKDMDRADEIIRELLESGQKD